MEKISGTETISDEGKNNISGNQNGSGEITDLIIGGNANPTEAAGTESESDTTGRETDPTENSSPETEEPRETEHVTETQATEPVTENAGNGAGERETQATEPGSETEEPSTETEEPATEPTTETEEPVTEPATEPATETEEPEPSPLDKIKAKKVLTYNTKPYKGEGDRKESPYVFSLRGRSSDPGILYEPDPGL